jgi:hypothetical protein
MLRSQRDAKSAGAFFLGVIAKGSNQVSDPERKRRENAEGRKNGEAVSQYSPGLRRSRYPGKKGEDYHNLEEVA